MLKLFFSLALVMLFSSSSLKAQEKNERAVSLGLSAENFGTLEAGYSTRKQLLGKTIRPGIKAAFPLTAYIRNQSFHAFEIQAGTDYDLIKYSSLKLKSEAYISVSFHKQILGQFIPVQYRLALIPSYRFKRSSQALLLASDQNLVTHIRHSEYVKERFRGTRNSFSESPADGFYAFTSTVLRLGWRAEFFISPELNLILEPVLLIRPASELAMFEGTKYGLVPASFKAVLVYHLSTDNK